jgi:hypothetical protein
MPMAIIPGVRSDGSMFRRLRTTSLAGSSALILVLVVSGVVAAASVLTTVAAPLADPDEPPVVDTTLTWEDLDGDGVDDDCDDAVEANEDAALAANLAVDLNGDGTVSVSEAAQSGRTGGVNCNHGGYVSWVAHETCGTADGDEPVDADEPATDEDVDADEAVETEAAADCEATEEEEPAEETTEEEQTAECADASTEDGTTPEDGDAEEPTTEVVQNGHGKVVREVARDKEAVGGKNCNHGGAVSDASHADNEARQAAREAVKEAREAARDAAKAERQAARDAKRSSKGSNGKGHGH